MSPYAQPDLEISPQRTRELLASDAAQVIDIREPYEHDAGRIDGVRHVELELLASQAETIDRDRPVVFYCRLGARSAMAAGAFRRAGYDAWSMAGGLQAWADLGLPMIPDGATVADH